VKKEPGGEFTLLISAPLESVGVVFSLKRGQIWRLLVFAPSTSHPYRRLQAHLARINNSQKCDS